MDWNQESDKSRYNRTYNQAHVHDIRMVTWVGMICNILLSVIKLIGGLVGNSQAVVADAIHSFSDLTTDVAILIGLRYWSAPADSEHPHGHRRIETMVTVAIGLLLCTVGIGIAFTSLSTLKEQDAVSPGWVALISTLISILVKEILYRWTAKVGTRIKSSALIANAWHHRSDALSSIPAAAAVGIALINPSWAFVDHIGAIIVALFIIQAAWQIFSPAAAELIDRGASQEICEHLQQVALNTPQVQEVHALRTRYLASNLVVDLHVLVDPNITVRTGHDISEIVKRRLFDSNQEVIDVIVHLEPYEGPDSQHRD